HAAAASAISFCLAPEITMVDVIDFEGILYETMPKLYVVLR
ncbi:cysteine desulfurase NifS, partial [Bacillus cereus]|nr:cysteine desulfurase NifS [Bacillus cereus]